MEGRRNELKKEYCVSVAFMCTHFSDDCNVCLASGEGLVYMTDEEVGALELSHKLVISSKEFPGVYC